MKINEIDNKIKEIEKELAELEKEETNKEDVIEKTPIDQTNEAINTIREVVTEIKGIEDLRTYREENMETYKNMILTIVSWFKYLKRKKSETNEYNEAKELVMSLGEKHTILYDWCKELVDGPELQHEQFINLNNIELNINESNKYVVNNDLMIVFDGKQVKDYDNKRTLSEELNSRVLDYKIIYKGTEYTCHHYYENYTPKWEVDEKCPFRVNVIDTKKDENGNVNVIFNVVTWNPVKIDK